MSAECELPQELAVVETYGVEVAVVGADIDDVAGDHGRGVDLSSGLEIPEEAARFLVDGVEPFVAASKDDFAGGDRG